MKIGGGTNVTAVDADVRNSYLPSLAAYLAVFTSSGGGGGGGIDTSQPLEIWRVLHAAHMHASPSK